MQLLALRTQFEAAAAQIDAILVSMMDVEDESQTEVCQHPKDRRLDLSTMGHIRWQCKECGYLYEEVS